MFSTYTGILLSSENNDMAFAKKFRVQQIVFTLMAKESVVMLSPYIPINSNDERSCYCTLLLHVPWPSYSNEENDRLFPEDKTAVSHLASLVSQKTLPPFVEKIMERIQRSETILQNIGTPQEGPDTSNSNIGYNDEHEENIYDDVEEDDEQENVIPSTSDEATISVNPVYFSEDGQIMTNITAESHQYFKNFIRASLDNCMQQIGQSNQIALTSELSAHTRGHKVNVHNYIERYARLHSDISTLKTAQRQAYDIITQYLRSDDKQLLMFVSGEGGTGKSKLIGLVIEFCRLHFGKQPGFYGACIPMAPTGSSANNIDGTTWQAALGKSRNEKQNGTAIMSPECAKKVGSKLNGCKLGIIDDIGMISSSSFYEISERIKNAKLALTSDPIERQSIKGKNDINYKSKSGCECTY